jgi:putative PIN family toxin of toxin-antitoxin system
MTRVVFDTNVYISAFFWKGTPFHLFQNTLRGEVLNYVSPQILKEVEGKLLKKFYVPPDKTGELLEIIAFNSTIVYPKRRLRVVKADPSDNKIIDCAVEARASYVISGDKHLLELKRYKNIKIVSPKEFYEKTK